MQTAARVHEIAPFHVMEVQTAARALEAAGRSVILAAWLPRVVQT